MKSLNDLFPGATTRELLSSNTPGWYSFNPSIANIQGEYKCIIRTSNFQVHQGVYSFNDPDGVCRTINYLASLDDRLNITSLDPIDYSDYDSDLFPVRGLEDARLCPNWDADPFLVGTCRDWSPSGVAKVAVCPLEGLKVVGRTFLPSFPPGAYAKNYMCIEGQGAFIERCEPPRHVYKDGSEVYSTPLPERKWIEGFRGGSQVIPVQGIRLAVIHEVEFASNGARTYWHRFVSFNNDYILYAASDRFFFAKKGIEFCAGLAVYKDSLVASFGLNDDQAMLAILPIKEVLASLKTIS